MNFDHFIQKQLELVEIEKNAEIDESKNLLGTCSLQRLQIKGLCLLKLRIEQKYTGLYGRTILCLQSAVPGKQINTQHFSSGDIVSISENGVSPSQLVNDKDVITGTVTKVTAQSVSVAIDTDIENVSDIFDECVKIIKLSNDITHKRIKNALTLLKSAKLNERASHMIDIIFQVIEPKRINISTIGSEQTSFLSNLEYFNKNLDESQKDAIKFTFEQNDLAIIHGPPGTGKTTTLVEIIKQNCLKFNQKILCCAPSNIAVDNLVERLMINEPGFKRLKLIRLGHPARLLEKIQDVCLDSILNRSEQYALANDIKNEIDQTLNSLRKLKNSKSFREQRTERDHLKREMRELRKELYKREERAMKEVIQSADIILATLSTSHMDGPLKHLASLGTHFDILIIDECSQSLEASCYIPMLNGARKLIVAGDHLQLPPTIISKEAADKGLDLTLMKRLIDSPCGAECTQMLTTQYRMNKLIMKWISDKLYESRLVASNRVAEHLLCDLQGVESDENTRTPLLLIDTYGCDYSEMVAVEDAASNNQGDEESSKANDGEANLVCFHVHDLIKQGLKQEDVAVITPYNLQVELIKAKLHSRYPNVEVKSVDGFQGREKEAVVISLVRSNNCGQVGFLSDQRRINVAVTRARRHLCVVCDTLTCKTNTFLKEFLTYMEENGVVRSGFDYEDAHNEDVGNDEDVKLDVGFGEIKFQKLRIANTSGPKSKETKTRKVKETRPREKAFVETEEDKLFKANTFKFLEKLMSESNDIEHTFSSDLTARQRRIVHEVAETLKLYHESKDKSETERYIVVSTKPLSTNGALSTVSSTMVSSSSTTASSKDSTVEIKKIEENDTKNEKSIDDEINNENDQEIKLSKNQLKKLRNRQKRLEDNEKKQKNETKLEEKQEDKSKKTSLPNAPQSLLGEVENQDDTDLKYRSDCKVCPNCQKFILNCNFVMHELHCSRVNQAATSSKLSTANALTSNTSSNDKKKTGKKSKEKSKVKANPIASANTDDFDELIDMFQKSNNVCNYEGCKTKVAVLGSDCEFCRARYCLTHSLAEVHGCGDEAKKKARAHIRKTGNLDVNEKQPTYMQQVKHKYVEKKFHEKLEAMQAARTGADKKKSEKK